jgi:hypothetical protein
LISLRAPESSRNAEAFPENTSKQRTAVICPNNLRAKTFKAIT